MPFRHFIATTLSGGYSGCLDFLWPGDDLPQAEVALTTGDICTVIDDPDYGCCVYEFDSTSSGNSYVPLIVKPQSTSEAGRWLLRSYIINKLPGYTYLYNGPSAPSLSEKYIITNVLGISEDAILWMDNTTGVSPSASPSTSPSASPSEGTPSNSPSGSPSGAMNWPISDSFSSSPGIWTLSGGASITGGELILDAPNYAAETPTGNLGRGIYVEISAKAGTSGQSWSGLFVGFEDDSGNSYALTVEYEYTGEDLSYISLLVNGSEINHYTLILTP